MSRTAILFQAIDSNGEVIGNALGDCEVAFHGWTFSNTGASGYEVDFYTGTAPVTGSGNAPVKPYQANATLTAALVSATAYTSLSVTALNRAIAAGDNVVLTSGANTQTFVASAPAAAGATTIAVTSLAANFSYPIGTYVDLATKAFTIQIPAASSKEYFEDHGIFFKYGLYAIASNAAVTGGVFWS